MAKVPSETPALYVVLESFVVDEDGVPVAYRKGEIIQPEHPVRKSRARLFGAFAFPHPIRARMVLDTPEVRAE